MNPPPSKINRFDLNSFSIVSTLSINNIAELREIDINNNNLYSVTEFGQIIKITLNNFPNFPAQIAYLGPGYDGLHFVSITPNGQYLLTATVANPSSVTNQKIVKINTNNLQLVGQTLLPASYQIIDAVIDPIGQYLYAGTYETPGKILKIRLSDMVLVGVITISNQYSRLFHVAEIEEDGQYAYFGTTGTSTQPARIVRIRLSDFTHQGTLLLGTNRDLGCVTIDNVNNKLYLGTVFDGTYPSAYSYVIKVDLNTFTEITPPYPILSGGNQEFHSCMYDEKNNKVIFASRIGSPGPSRIVRVNSLPLAQDTWTFISNTYEAIGTMINYKSPSIIIPPGTASLGFTFNIVLSDEAHPNRPYALALSLGNSPGFIMPGGLLVNLATDAIFWASIDLISPGSPSQTLNGLLVNSIGYLNNQGTATAQLTIPNNPSLSGLTVYGAFIVTDFSKTVALSVSPTVSFTIT